MLDQYRSPISDRRVNNEVKSCRSCYVATITGMLEDVQLHYNPFIAGAIVPLDYWTCIAIPGTTNFYIGSSSRAEGLHSYSALLELNSYSARILELPIAIGIAIQPY